MDSLCCFDSVSRMSQALMHFFRLLVARQVPSSRGVRQNNNNKNPEDIWCLIRKICYFNIHKWIFGSFSSRNIRCHSKSQFGTALNKIQFSVVHVSSKTFVNIWNFSFEKRDFFPVGIQLTIVTHLFFCAGVELSVPYEFECIVHEIVLTRKCIRDHWAGNFMGKTHFSLEI